MEWRCNLCPDVVVTAIPCGRDVPGERAHYGVNYYLAKRRRRHIEQRHQGEKDKVAPITDRGEIAPLSHAIPEAVRQWTCGFCGIGQASGREGKVAKKQRTQHYRTVHPEKTASEVKSMGHITNGGNHGKGQKNPGKSKRLLTLWAARADKKKIGAHYIRVVKLTSPGLRGGGDRGGKERQTRTCTKCMGLWTGSATMQDLKGLRCAPVSSPHSPWRWMRRLQAWAQAKAEDKKLLRDVWSEGPGKNPSEHQWQAIEAAAAAAGKASEEEDEDKATGLRAAARKELAALLPKRSRKKVLC